MEYDRSIQSAGLKIITITAIAILIFSTYTIFVNDNEGGESNVLISVDEYNQFKVVKKGNSVIHDIEIENTGGGDVIVLLYANITDVTDPGIPGNWSVRFFDGFVEITNKTIGFGETVTIGVEVTASNTAVLDETATTVITARDAVTPLSGPTNVSKTSQNGVVGESITLTTRRTQSYQPMIEIAPGTESRKQVNPLFSTAFKVKVTNIGFDVDSIRLKANVGSPTRGETRASETWTVKFSPSSLIQDLLSINDGIGSSHEVFVNVTAPSNAVYGDYPITIIASSVNGNEDDSLVIKAVVPIPDLFAKPEDITFSRFPVIDGQNMVINVTIHNGGGAVEDEFKVQFWIEDTVKKNNYNIIGEKTVNPIGNQDDSYTTVQYIAELHPSIDETLTTTGIRIIIDADSEITESDEDNNQVESDLEILKAPGEAPGYVTTLWMILVMVGVGAVLVAGEKWKRERKRP